jgi:integrase
VKKRITKSTVEAAKPGTRDAYIWDDQIAGFGAKVTPLGRRVYVLKYVAGGSQRWMTIGRHGEITAEEARTRAQKLRGQIADGADPAQVRDRHDPTVADLAQRFLSEHAEIKDSTLGGYRLYLDTHILPKLGRLHVSDVTRQEVLRLHHELRAKPFTANRVASLLSVMFNQAESWGLRPENTNPARRIKRFAEPARKRYLTIEELERLGTVLAEAEAGSDHPTPLAVIKLLLLTGCRLGEALKLEWSFIDIAQSCLRLPDSKTGAKVINVGPGALQLLAGQPRTSSKYVFPAAKGDKRRTVDDSSFRGMWRVWRRLCGRAGIEGARIHDIRHSFASHAVMGGMSLPMVGALLGHARPSTTQRYAHFANRPQVEAATRVEGTISGALGGKRGKVVKIGARAGR